MIFSSWSKKLEYGILHTTTMTEAVMVNSPSHEEDFDDVCM